MELEQMLSGIANAGNNPKNEYPAKWVNRTVESIKDEIIEAESNKRSIVGPCHDEVNRAYALVRRQESISEFNMALLTVAEHILDEFPNPPEPQPES